MTSDKDRKPGAGKRSIDADSDRSISERDTGSDGIVDRTKPDSGTDSSPDTTLANEWLGSTEGSLTDTIYGTEANNQAQSVDSYERELNAFMEKPLPGNRSKGDKGDKPPGELAGASKRLEEILRSVEPSLPSLAASSPPSKRSLETIDQEITLEEGPINTFTSSIDVTADFPTSNNVNDIIYDTGGHDQQATLVAIAKSESSSEQTLKWLSGHADPEIRASVASNPKTSFSVLQNLTQDWYSGVRAAILDNPKVPIELVTKLLSDTNPIISLKACKTIDARKQEITGAIPRRAAQKISENNKQKPRREADQTNPELPDLHVYHKYLSASRGKAVSEAESKDAVDFLELVARRWNTPPKRLQELAKHPDEVVRKAVAGNSNTPIDTLWALAFDPSAPVKVSLTKNESCPVALLRALERDTHPQVQRSAREILKQFEATH